MEGEDLLEEAAVLGVVYPAFSPCMEMTKETHETKHKTKTGIAPYTEVTFRLIQLNLHFSHTVVLLDF